MKKPARRRLPPSTALQLGLFHLDATGLTVTGKPTFAEWQECGRQLRRIVGTIQFWIGDWLNEGEKRYGEKYAQAVDPSEANTWRQYAWVAHCVEMSIRIDNLSWSHHQLVASFFKTPELQQTLLKQAIGLTVTEFKELIRRYLHGEKIAAITRGHLSHDEYDVICADPPWQYDNSGFDQSAAAHYPTMALEAICNLPVTDESFPKFADPCVLFLWATSPLLPDAITVMTAWGFDYKACMVWIKDKAPGLGWWVQTRHELLLIGVRGASTPLEKVDSVITATVSAHSRKPDAAFAAIDRMYPEGLRRVECFAREKRDGWERWGNEV